MCHGRILCSKEEQKDGNHNEMRTWVLPISSDVVSPGVFVQSLKGKEWEKDTND